jgi:hypothetical protein
MVVSRSPLCRSGRLLRVLGLDRRNDLTNPYNAVHALALLLAIQQHRPSPPLEPRAASCACAIPLAVPD